MTDTLVLLLLAFLFSSVIALMRSAVNASLKSGVSCRMFLDDRSVGGTDVMEGEGFYLNVELSNASLLPFPRRILNISLPDGLRFGNAKDSASAEKAEQLRLTEPWTLLGKSRSVRRFWVHAVRRGAYTLDYAVLVREKSFGMDLLSFRLPVPVGRSNSATVYPAVMELEEAFTTAPYTTGDVEVRRSPLADPPDLIGVRPYRNDPLSRINWKKSAAVGEWMTNENGFTEERGLTILLNLQSRAYERYESTGGISSTDLTELCISAAASLIDEISAYEVPVRVLFNGESDAFCTAEEIGENRSSDEAYRCTFSNQADSLPDYHDLMRMLARITGGVTVPAHMLFYAVAGEPEKFLCGRNLIVVSPYFDSVMKDFARSLQSVGIEVVFSITSLFSDPAEIPEDVPVFYRTYRDEKEKTE